MDYTTLTVRLNPKVCTLVDVHCDFGLTYLKILEMNHYEMYLSKLKTLKWQSER